MTERRRMFARGDQPGEMGHVDEQQGSDLVANRAEAGEIEVARIGRATGDDHLRLVLFGESLDLLEVDQMVVAADAILDGVEPFDRLRRGSAVRQVTAGSEAEAHDGIAG